MAGSNSSIANMLARTLTSLEALSSLSDVSLFEIRSFVISSELHYVKFRLPKKNGGYRVINAPSAQLKMLQKWIAQNVLSLAEPHEAATGYKKGSSIVHNAIPHCQRDFVFNVDIEHFFPSISERQVKRVFQSLGFTREMSDVLTYLCTLDEELPQGAPTSPTLANLVCRRLDRRLQGLVNARGWYYTRYCDDITISGYGDFKGQQNSVLSIIEDEGFSVNWNKIRLAQKSSRQTVTGLVVNARPNVDRKRRRQLRAAMHKAAQTPEVPVSEQLRGLLAYLQMVEKQSSPADTELLTN